MKKLSAIFLSLLLTVSFSGMSFLAAEELPVSAEEAQEEVVLSEEAEDAEEELEAPGDTEEAEADELESSPETKPLEELTAEELSVRIKNMLAFGQDLLVYLPEIKAVFDEEGKVVQAEYSLNGVWTNIEDLDRETLKKLHGRVASERVRVINERTMRQLRQERIRTMNERRMRDMRNQRNRTSTDRQLRQLRQLKAR